MHSSRLSTSRRSVTALNERRPRNGRIRQLARKPHDPNDDLRTRIVQTVANQLGLLALRLTVNRNPIARPGPVVLRDAVAFDRQAGNAWASARTPRQSARVQGRAPRDCAASRDWVRDLPRRGRRAGFRTPRMTRPGLAWRGSHLLDPQSRRPDTRTRRFTQRISRTPTPELTGHAPSKLPESSTAAEQFARDS